MSGASRRASLALVVGVVAACSRSPIAPSRSPSIVASLDAPSRHAPPRYVVPNALTRVERLGDRDRVVVGGRRVELRGRDVIASASPDPEVEGGARQPPWARGASDPAAYVFWRGRDVFAAPSFTAPLKKIATLPRDVARAAPWLDGVVLLGASGALVVRPNGAALARIAIAGGVDALAVDARRAIVLTPFDRIWLTLDGCTTRRDLTAEIPEAIGLFASGDRLVVRRHGGGDRVVDAAGIVSGAGAEGTAQARDAEDLWPADQRETALEAAVTKGLVLGDDSAIAVSGGTYARIDLTTGRAASIASVADEGAECAPFRAPDAPLLLCVTADRAFVVHADSGARREKTFDLAGAPDVDRFVGTDGEALGYVGPCEGTASPLPEVDAVSGASQTIASFERSATFCVRAGPERWIEHRLDRADARDVIAWIPRAGGDAIALVARDAAMLADADRVSVHGSLRIVRIARTEPPLSLPTYADRATEVLSRRISAGSDGSIEGWLSSSSASVVAVMIDRDGHPRVLPAPAAIDGMATAGRFGLAASDDGRVFETIDRGRTWLAVAASPEIEAVTPSTCTEVGCRIGSLLRIGWTDHAGRASDIDENALDESVHKRRSRTSPPLAPIAELRCEGAAAPVGGRIAGSFAFGLTKTVVAQTNRPMRIAGLGTMIVPYSTPGLPPSGDAELAWVAPLDVAGIIERRSIPLTNTAFGVTGRSGEARVGFVLGGDGVSAVALGADDACLAPLLDSAGVTRSFGGCWPDPSVGVELDERAIFAGYRGDALVVSSVALRREAGRKDGGVAVAGSARELMRVAAPPGARARSLAIGARRGKPVLVAIDGGGEAILAPIEAEHGALGAEEPLASLGGIGLASSAACAGPTRADEARVVFPLEGQIGLVPGVLRGVTSAGRGGFAVIRWSRERACLEAIELGVHDERFEGDLGSFDPPTTLRNLVARFSSSGRGTEGAALIEIGSGFEIRQRLSCAMRTR